MRKRIHAWVLIAMLLITIIPTTSAFAVQARFAYVRSISVSLTRSGSTLDAFGSGTAISDSDLVYVTATLLRYPHEGGSWNYAGSWSSSGVGFAGAAVSAYPTVEAGYDYKLHVNVQIRDADGNILESVGMDSDTVSYPRS